ncbi:uridine kinase [uncultured Jatrophihabitans sp.]|uniref:uridine kinase n=1 Tax=uncultured Jatrophihabitans sp. TaxID=1610747 RepID=UPI0035CC1AC4
MRPPGYVPLARDAVVDRLADRFTASPGALRVALDGDPSTEPGAWGDELVAALRVRGRPGVHVRAETFWRDASLRLEYGHQDLESYRAWLDTVALRREVLDPLVTSGSYLPSLRDPATNRSTREPARDAEPGTVLVVSGSLLLGHGLPFDQVVHLTASPAARARRTPEQDAWTLAAYVDYDDEVQPIATADVVVKVEDPARPAVRGL